MSSLCAPNKCIATASLAPQSGKYVQLGRTSLQVSRLGIGTLQWGDPASGFGSKFGEAELAGAFRQLIKGGINFIDTAEVYGYQGIKDGTSAEQLIGKFANEHSQGVSDTEIQPVIATKFFTIPWTNFLVGGGLRLGRKSLLNALQRSLQRMGRKRVDLYQIHFPFPTFSNAALMESLKESVELGLTEAVGVSNYSKQKMEEADDILRKYGIPLASNQVRFNLLHRSADKEGLLKACKERNISLLAYSPLASGSLTDKEMMKESSKHEKSRRLLEIMREIGTSHNNKSIAQVALSYLIVKGAIPIPACKNESQARSHCELLEWSITMDEVRTLEEAADHI